MARKIPNQQETEKLLNKYGSPLNICYEQTLIDNTQQFFKHFKKYPGGFKLYYSVKTNPIVGILKVLKEQQVKAEVCSPSDLEAALRAGYTGENIIYDGLIKSDADLEAAINKNVELINIESIDEANRLVTITNKLRKKIGVGIRLRFPSAKVGLTSLLGVSYERFGVNSHNGEAQEAARIIVSSKYLQLKGLHCHTGSNQKSSKRYKIGIDEMVAFAKHLKNEYQIEIEEINLGGGFGINEITAYKMTGLGINFMKNFLQIPNTFQNAPIDFPKISQEIVTYLTKKLTREGLKFPTLCLEPGRRLVGNSTHLLCTIVGVKDTVKTRWVIIDAGTNLLPVLTMFSEFHEIVILSKNKLIKSSLSGPLLYSSDILVSNRLLPKGNIGDNVIIADVGAYCSSQSNQFLYPRAPTILVGDKRHQILQRRETIDDVLQRDKYQ